MTGHWNSFTALKKDGYLGKFFTDFSAKNIFKCKSSVLEKQINSKLHQISYKEHSFTILKCTSQPENIKNFYLCWRKRMKTRQFIRTYLKKKNCVVN